MSGWAIAAAVAGLVAAGRAALAAARAIRHPVVARARIVTPPEHTEIDAGGAVRSTQAAELVLPAGRLREIWTPAHLERLARTYWRFLSRCTLGLVRVVYTPRERFVVLVARPLALLRFQAPEYEMDAARGVVRWRIERGLLVSRRGRGAGHLQIEVRRREDRSGPDRDPGPDGDAILHVEVEVAGFHPAIASRLSRLVYANTQSRIHVVVTHGFLRSLSRLDLATSRVGRFSAPPDAPTRTAARR